MVFPDSNSKETIFLTLFGWQGQIHFSWSDNIDSINEIKNNLRHEPDSVLIFAGEIAILKDLTNMEK